MTIVVLTALALALGLDVRTVGDMGALPDTLPVFLIPDISAYAGYAAYYPALFHCGGRGRVARKPDDPKHCR